jgi:inosine/xanthosine triphosphate pyrophosphatase family protein
MLLLQALHIRSAYIFAMIVTILLVGAIGDVAGKLVSGRRGKLSFGWSYILTMSGFVVLGVEAVTTVWISWFARRGLG